MRVDTGAGVPMSSSRAFQADVGLPRAVEKPNGGSDTCGEWLKVALDRVIAQQRPRVPGWGLLRPHQNVGEYSAENDYLLLVFDHRGQPHTRRFSEDEIRRLKASRDQADGHFRNLIQSFCSDA